MWLTDRHNQIEHGRLSDKIQLRTFKMQLQLKAKILLPSQRAQLENNSLHKYDIIAFTNPVQLNLILNIAMLNNKEGKFVFLARYLLIHLG